jgi:hypothetical protein
MKYQYLNFKKKEEKKRKEEMQNILNSLRVKYTNSLPIYFPSWLSGLIEA